MTDEQLRRIRRIVEFTCAEQGVPVHLEDPATIRKIVRLLDPNYPCIRPDSAVKGPRGKGR